jgi:hypothetical protein
MKMNCYTHFSRPIIVVFIGNVGTGKTTHIYALSKVLNKHRNIVYTTTLKTVFPFTKLAIFLTRHNIPLLRIAVSLDLLFNNIRLPILACFKTVVLPLLKRRKIVLIDEYLPGSLVDYICNGAVYNIMPISIVATKILFRLFVLLDLTRFNLVYLYCNKNTLPERWVRRGTFPEKKLYIAVQDLVFIKFIKKYDNVLKINTSKKFALNHQVIKNYIMSLLNTRCNTRA